MNRLLALVLLAPFSVAACEIFDDDDHHHDRDTRVTSDTGSADTADTGSPDTGPDPDAQFLPAIVEFRGRPFSWLRRFAVVDDGAALLTTVEAPGSTLAAREVALGRVDVATGEVTLGPEVTAGERPIDLLASAEPGAVWLVDYEARTLRALTVATMTTSTALALPASAELRNATWAIDGRAVAFAHGPTSFASVFVVMLPEAASTWDPTTATPRSVPIPVNDFLRMRLTGTGYLIVSGAPAEPRDPDCLFCADEPDVERGYFRIYDVAAAGELAPIVSEHRYEGTFRVSPSGRWLYRTDLAGRVTAAELPGLLAERVLPCLSVATMELGPDDRVICPAASRALESGEVVGRLTVLDAEAEEVATIDVPMPLILEVIPSTGWDYAWVHGTIVDVSVTPPVIVGRPSVPTSNLAVVAGGDYAWAYQPVSADGGAWRVAWADGAALALPEAGLGISQIEPIDGGVAVGRLEVEDTIELWGEDGVVRSVVKRTLPE